MAAQESKHGDLNFAVDLKRSQISRRRADHQLKHHSLKYRVGFRTSVPMDGSSTKRLTSCFPRLLVLEIDIATIRPGERPHLSSFPLPLAPA
jgi:hypothetical protein